MHEGQVDVPSEVVALLVADQFPEFAGQPIRMFDSAGTVNALFRLGDELVARFPLRSADGVRASLMREVQASAEFAEVSPVPAPEPVALGEPGRGYPMPWSIQTWVPGVDATSDDPGESVAFADDLARLIEAMWRADIGGRVFAGQGRGGVLAEHDAWVETCLGKSGGLFDVDLFRDLWQELRRLPAKDGDVMSHQDLIPSNLLVDRGRLTGVIDTGSFGPADPALDLVSAWHLLERGPRSALRSALDVDEVVWQRGRAWALQQALGLVWYYRETNPVMSRIGLRTLGRIAER